jgi:hypothetical protein
MQAGGSGFRENVGAYRTGIWSHGWRVAGYSAIGMEALCISMLRNIVHYIIPHVVRNGTDRRTLQEGSSFRLRNISFAALTVMQSVVMWPEREGGESIWVISYIFRLFLGVQCQYRGLEIFDARTRITKTVH